MPTMNLRLALINLRFLTILFPSNALRSFLESMIFLDTKWMFLDFAGYNWIQKLKAHEKNHESHDFFGYKLDSEATPTRSRTYTMDTEKILFIIQFLLYKK